MKFLETYNELNLLHEDWESINIRNLADPDQEIIAVIIDKRFTPIYNKHQQEILKNNNVKVVEHALNGVVVRGKVKDILAACDECHVMNPTKQLV